MTALLVNIHNCKW